MSKTERNDYCKKITYYDKRFKSKITILKICDRLYCTLKKTNYNIKDVTCPYCKNELV